MAVRLGLVGPNDSYPERRGVVGQDKPHKPGLNVEDAADQLGVAVPTVYRMIHDGRVAAIKHAGRYFIKPAAISEYFTRIEAEAERRRADAERAAIHDHGLPPLPPRGGKPRT